MSKGHGVVQRRILGVFERTPDSMLKSADIAAAVFEHDLLTDSDLASARRALRGFVRDGRLVDMGRCWHDGQKRWALPDKARAYHDRVKTVFRSA